MSNKLVNPSLPVVNASQKEHDQVWVRLIREKKYELVIGHCRGGQPIKGRVKGEGAAREEVRVDSCGSQGANLENEVSHLFVTRLCFGGNGNRRTPPPPPEEELVAMY